MGGGENMEPLRRTDPEPPAAATATMPSFPGWKRCRRQHQRGGYHLGHCRQTPVAERAFSATVMELAFSPDGNHLPRSNRILKKGSPNMGQPESKTADIGTDESFTSLVFLRIAKPC